MKSFVKRIKILGEWAASRGYDKWDIFIGKRKWCSLIAVTRHPIQAMLQNHSTANIDWSTVRAVKLT